MTQAERVAQQCLQRRIAAALVHEAKLKEHEAACWLGLSKNIEESRHAVHSALDATLDATQNQIDAIKAQHGSAA